MRRRLTLRAILRRAGSGRPQSRLRPRAAATPRPRLTARGWALLGAGPALIALGLAGRYLEFAAIGVAAVAALVVAIAFVARAPRLAVSRDIAPIRVTRGEPCQVRLRVARRRRGSVNLGLTAVDRCGAISVEAPLAPLRRARDTAVEYAAPTARRGVVDIGPLRIRRADPLRLLSAVSRHGDVDRIWVYPKVYPMAGMARGVTRSLDGLDDNVASGTITFDRLRPYVRGDEMRHVHWRTSARLGELMVREHVEESVPTVVLLLDDRACAYRDPDDFEEACDGAASLAAAATAADLSPTLLMTVAHPAGPIMDQLAEVTLAGTATAGVEAADLTASNTTGAGVGAAGGIADLIRRAGGDTIVLFTGDADGATPAVAAVSGLGSPRTTVVIAQFGAADGGAASGGAGKAGRGSGGAASKVAMGGALAVESTADRVLRLRLPDAGAFATAWQRRHGAAATVTATPGTAPAPGPISTPETAPEPETVATSETVAASEATPTSDEAVA